MCPRDHCVRVSSSRIHQLSDPEVGNLGCECGGVDEDVVSGEVAVCSGWGGAMEVGQSQGYLMEDGDLVRQMKGLLRVRLKEL